MEISWQVEIDPYCQKILALRYPESKKYRDIKTLKGADLEPIDILTGGFPCQPFSVAGKQKGKEDNRYLWPEMLRVIKECRPRWVVGENVPGIINLALDTVCSDLEAEGYEVWPIVFPSHALGAWHKRDRLWIVCHAKCNGLNDSTKRGSIIESQNKRGMQESEGHDSPPTPVEDSRCQLQQRGVKQGTHGVEAKEQNANFSERSSKAHGKTISNPNTEGLQGSMEAGDASGEGSYTEQLVARHNSFRAYWEFEPNVGRVANGIADRVHRLKMLGNGQVPACTYVIGKMIMEIEANVFQK